MATAFSFSGQWALITGASSGIGKEYAKQLAQKGCHLLLAARRQDRLEELARSLRSSGVQVFVLPCDLSVPLSATPLFKKALSTIQGPLTLLINNAGIGKYGPFEQTSLEEHLQTIQLNVTSVTELSHHFLAHAREHGQPSLLVQVSSMAGFQPLPHFVVYSATKEYVRSFSETLAFELKGKAVRVFCLCPGGTLTEFFEHSGQNISRTGQAAMMTPQDLVAQALAAMAQPQTSPLFIPGWVNRLGCFLPRFFSRAFALRLGHAIMKKALQQKSTQAH